MMRYRAGKRYTIRRKPFAAPSCIIRTLKKLSHFCYWLKNCASDYNYGYGPNNRRYKMNKFAQKIELASQVAIIIVAALIGAVLVKNHLLNTSQPKGAAVNNKPAAGQNTDAGLNGKAISLPDVDWKKGDQTLVLALSTTCHFCSESAPFYKQVIEKRKGSTRLIAVLPQSVEAGRQYLSGLGITVDEVRQAPPSSLGVQGTPTLLLVNKAGVVTSSWRGKLPQERELEVIAKL